MLRGDAPENEALVRRHRRPEPRLGRGPGAGAAGASAMIDLSDGHRRRAPGRPQRRRAPAPGEASLAAGVDEAARAAGADPLELAATGGDDYELLVCFAADGRDAAEAAAAAAGLPLTWLGEVRAGSGVALVGPDGAVRPGLRGFEHL